MEGAGTTAALCGYPAEPVAVPNQSVARAQCAHLHAEMAVQPCERAQPAPGCPGPRRRPPLPVLLGGGKGSVARISEAGSRPRTTRPYRVSAAPRRAGWCATCWPDCAQARAQGCSRPWALPPSRRPHRAHQARRGLRRLSALQAKLRRAEKTCRPLGSPPPPLLSAERALVPQGQPEGVSKRWPGAPPRASS